MINMDINELVELMVETIAVKQPVIRINKYDFPYDVVRSRLEKIDFHTIEYVLECLRNNATKVRNIRSYMLTTLYNAPVTCSRFFDIINATVLQIGIVRPEKGEWSSRWNACLVRSNQPPVASLG